MQETYPADTNQEEYYVPPQPKKAMSGWLIALIVVLALVVVCCVCACVAWLLAGPTIGNTFSTIIETLEATTPMP